MSKIGIALCALLIGAVAGVYLSDDYRLSSRGLQYRPALTFADGAIYAGPLDKDGRASGKGTMEWPNGNHYKGEFRDGMMHGNGLFTTPAGYVYEGDFAQGSGTGRATIHYTDGSVYEGEMHQDNMHGQGKLTFSKGNYYQGEFTEGRIEGSGSWIVTGDHQYRGQLKNAKYQGDGELVFENGSRYTGRFSGGNFQGTGSFTTADGIRYDGTFDEGNFSGKGVVTYPNGETHVGEFRDWQPQGKGIRTDADGNQYLGIFSNGYLDGAGEYIGHDGERYKGDFTYGQYAGDGELWTAEGDHYVGEFRYGRKHGEGDWTAKEAEDGVKEYSGQWRNGTLVSAEGDLKVYSAEDISEHALYQQLPLLDKRLAEVQTGNPDTIDLFTLAIASYGSQEVFRREINYIEQDFTERFHNQPYSIFLSNSRRSLDDRPLATLTSVDKSLQTIAGKMDNDQDILFLYISSHGSQDKTIAIEQPGLALPDLSADKLRALLDNSGIKWRVIVLSACYSGGFIDALKDDHTLILTAAAADKTSFGCEDNNHFTYFGEAFFKDALPQSDSFVDAFHRAKALIGEWEDKDELEHSNPQISEGKKISQQLERWRKQNRRLQ